MNLSLLVSAALIVSLAPAAAKKPAKGKKRPPAAEVVQEAPPVEPAPTVVEVPPPPPPVPKAAVMATRVGDGLEPGVGASLTNRIADALQKRAGFQVISPDDVRALLEHEANRQLVGCEDDSCVAELAQALGVDFIVTSQVDKLDAEGAGWSLSLTSVDARTASVHARAADTWRGDPLLLFDIVPALVDRLTKSGEITGSVAVKDAPAGARVVIDGKEMGTLPQERFDNVPVGARRLEVSLADHEPVDRWIIVQRNETVTVSAPLVVVEAPFYATWWFWTAAGLGTAAVATGGIIAAVLLQNGGGGGQTGVDVAINANDTLGRGARP